MSSDMEDRMQVQIDGSQSENESLRQRIEELEAQLAEAQKDADRYRWLRDKGDNFADSLTDRWMMDATRIDEIIDAAMESE